MRFIDSIKELLAIYAGLVVLAAVAYAQLEHATFGNALWWACVTALTIGYGDMYPHTVGGKIVAVLLMHGSVLFLLPLIIGNICGICIRNPNEFTDAEQEEIKATLRRLESRLESLTDRQQESA